MRNTKPPDKGSTTLDKVISLLEALREAAMDGEAMAYGAADCLQRMPYIPRTQRMAEEGVDIRLELGRLHSYVFAAARIARELLDDIDHILAVAHGRDGGEGKGGSGSGGDGNGNGDRGEDIEPDPDADNGADNRPGTSSVHSPEEAGLPPASTRQQGTVPLTQRAHTNLRPPRSRAHGSCQARQAQSPTFTS